MFETVIQKQLKKNGRNPVYIDNRVSVTYKEMSDDIGCCSAWLKTRGIGRGDRVVLRLSSFYLQWVLFFALENRGAVSILTSTYHKMSEFEMNFLQIHRYITDIVIDGDLAASNEFIDRGWLARVRRFRPNFSASPCRSADDPVCILLSSGTTGSAKKVLITRSLLDTRAITDRSSELINPQSRLLLLYPKYSVGSLVSTISVLAVGATVCVRLSDFRSEATLEKIRPTMIMGAPSHYGSLLSGLSENFAPTREIDASTGGGSIPSSVVGLMRKKLGGKIKISYASTEAGLIARGDISVAEEHDGAVGFVLPSVDVSIRSEAGLDLPVGETGEIWVRSPHIVSRYLEDPEQTALSFRDGWFRPGDVGSLQADGLLKVNGRTDDLMNYRGIKILPSSIEKLLNRSEWCRECITFMTDASNDREREVWIICVVSGNIEIEDVRNAFPAHVPFSFASIDSMPRNEMGKIKRTVLQAQAERGHFDGKRVVDRGSGHDDEPRLI